MKPFRSKQRIDRDVTGLRPAMWKHAVFAPCSAARAGFTLVELLVVIAIIGVLGSLLMPSLSSSKAKVQRVACCNNIRQILLASLMYSDEDRLGSFTTDTRQTPGKRSDSDDDLSHFYPRPITDLRVFLCPATRNRIRSDLFKTDPITGESYLADLSDYDHGPADAGMSYECFGVMAWEVRKTIDSVNAYVHKNTNFNLFGIQPGPSQIWLILDGEKGRNTLANGNHGSTGANVGHCDGHVDWIRKPDWDRRYEISQDEGDGNPN